MRYSIVKSVAIEDVTTTLLIEGTFAADLRMPTVALIAGLITSLL
jgi:hypothetical protein